MNTYSKILVVIDPELEQHPSLNKAVHLAKQYQAKLELFISDYDPLLATSYLFDAPSLERATQTLHNRHCKLLERMADSIRQQGIETTCDVRWQQRPADCILDKAEESGADLIVRCSHPNDGQDLPFSHTDWDLIREASVPLLLVKHQPWQASPKILVAIDPMHTRAESIKLEQKLLGEGTALAEKLSGEVHALHAFDPSKLEMHIEAGVIRFPDTPGHIRELHKAAFAETIKQSSIDPANQHLLEAVPEKGIVDFAKKNSYDITVMGAISRSAIERVLIGHTAEKILEKISSDLLIIKP
ncbi:universal stress protein [Pelagibaculum spongiae]|uniref:UspA domain-containing protein n=1 Tax=Pelagibaculum spongiae TaxID=2080658 RepID=A0A2V1GWG7_9GAMM|nr:universal stress protein [Pelagibaculum spongiae]PVZ64992.1 hypothetical protein DC094_19220 [Pelagibaculum spongiae]